jgi:CubicO group peptidase (beta-lactamase class C family)
MTPRRHFIKQAGLATAGLIAPRLSLNALGNPENKRFPALQEAIASHTSLLKIPGLLAAVVENGSVTYVQTEGFADLEKKLPMRRDHIFPVASLTKTFAAVTLALYEQEGRISMDDYILDYPFLPVGLTPERLQSSNVKIKHVLSHTSEGEPGDNYMYNGNRYSFVYGVFEKMSGNTKHYEAFAAEVKRRVLHPLQMKDTYTGYPGDKNCPGLPRIVTTYQWDRERQFFKADTGLSGQTTLFPATNLFTTIDDLAAYTNALDQNTLLNSDSYKSLTTPFVTNSGRKSPYGMGWATQQVNGKQLHWHYGYGDSYAALIIRVPADKLSFILLSNSAPISEAFYLGYGNVLTSPFAQAFLRCVVFRRSGQFSYQGFISNPGAYAGQLFNDELLSQALMRKYAEEKYQEHLGEAEALMRHWAQFDPARFEKMEVSLIHILAQFTDPQLNAAMESAIAAYAATGYFHADIHLAIADWYGRTGNPQSAREWYHKLADSKGYGEQGAVKNACTALGKYYLENGETEKGRTYLWREALYSPNDAANQIALMKR